jgi:hypothetical protein
MWSIHRDRRIYVHLPQVHRAALPAIGLGLVVVLGGLYPYWAHALGNLNCPSCEVLARQRFLDSRENVLTPAANSNVDQSWNVANLMHRSLTVPGNVLGNARDAGTSALGIASSGDLGGNAVSPIQFWQRTAQPQLPEGTQGWWNGQGELPGGFQRPWEFPKTDFDPSFKTSYYTTERGFYGAPDGLWQKTSWGLSPFVFTASPNLWPGFPPGLSMDSPLLQGPQWF